MTTYHPERRLDRSPYIDQALEKLLGRIRDDHTLVALVLADEEGHLVAAVSAEGRSEADLAGLGALSADLQVHLRAWPSISPPALVQVQGQGNQRLIVRHLAPTGPWLSLCVVSEAAVDDDVFTRAEDGVRRILHSGELPAMT